MECCCECDGCFGVPESDTDDDDAADVAAVAAVAVSLADDDNAGGDGHCVSDHSDAGGFTEAGIDGDSDAGGPGGFEIPSTAGISGSGHLEGGCTSE